MTTGLTNNKSILLAITGASGAIYAKRFIEKIISLNTPLVPIEIYIIFSETAKEVFEHETGCKYCNYINETIEMQAKPSLNIQFIENNNYKFKYASGSNELDSMIILPCSMGSLARIAQGLSIDLIGRIADVQLKEKRPLIIVPREAPYSLIHLQNMLTLAQAGATIIPASPSFYNKPISLDDLIDSFVERILDTARISNISDKYKW